MTATRSAVDELTDFCRVTYGVPPVETRILVSSFLPTRYPPLWLLIQSEPNAFTEDMSYCATRLRASGFVDSWYYRGERPRKVNRLVTWLMNERATASFVCVDRFWRRPHPPVLRQSQYPRLAAECVRMRLTWDPNRFPDRREELWARVKAALEAAAGDRGGVVPYPMTEEMERRAALLPLIDRYLADRTALVRNLCFVASNHAALCGRTQPAEPDLRAQAHIIRSSIPFWMDAIITAFLAHGAGFVAIRQIINATGFENEWRNLGSKLNPLRLGEKLVRELWANGFLERHKNGKFRIRPEYVDDLYMILWGSPKGKGDDEA